MTEPVAIVVFAKAPIPGQAKTRMMPRLGVAGALICSGAGFAEPWKRWSKRAWGR